MARRLRTDKRKMASPIGIGHSAIVISTLAAQMNRRRRNLIVIGALAIVALAAVVALISDRSNRTALAADGRSVTVVKVTHGTDHRFTRGDLWVRILKPVLGQQWAARRGAYELRFTNATPTLMVWTLWDHIYRTNSVALEATILDERGTESELTLSRWNMQGRWTRRNDPGQNQVYVGWQFGNFPRRSDQLRLRIYDRDKRSAPTQAVELAFANPTPQRFAKWRGATLPLTITNGVYEFAMMRLHQVSNALWQIDFEGRGNGRPDPAWRIGRLEVTDATGNLISVRSNMTAALVTNLTFRLNAALWPEERVRKFAVEFCRVADFSESELWRLPNITVPPPRNPTMHIHTNLTVGSVNIGLDTFPQNVPYFPGGLRRNGHVHLKFHGAGHRLLLLQIADEQQRAVAIEPGHVSPDGLHTFGLVIPRGAQTLDFTFAIRKSHWVEFLVESPAPAGTE